jgi:protein MpaA
MKSLSSENLSEETKIKPELPVTLIKKNASTSLKVEKLPKIVQTLIFDNSKKVTDYCKKIDRYFKKYKWGKSKCDEYSWHHVRSSHLGNPIIWYVYGDEKNIATTPKNTTMIFCGVHGDEITPVKFCFDVLEDLKKNPQVLKDNLVVIAPLVTPDAFLKRYPTRTNARGIDVNRNFPTKDWNKNARKAWKKRYRSNKRRNPGMKSLSEQETVFQVNLIKRYKPNKIISVHSPLTLIDYDGPSTKHKHGNDAELLLVQMSNKAGKYKINNYPFFTGSLGNWAGNERNIPTYTLELPNSDWNKTDRFFRTFRTAIHHAISHELKAQEEKVTNTEKNTGNDSVL